MQDLVMTRRDFGVLIQALTDIAEDSGTQPAYRRGMKRAMSAFQNVLVEERHPLAAARDTWEIS